MTAKDIYPAQALLQQEMWAPAIASMIKTLTDWPEPYHVSHGAELLGPLSWAQIKIKRVADKEFWAEAKAYHEPSGQWLPLRELAKLWAVDGFTQTTDLPTPVKPARTEGTKDNPIPIVSASYIGVSIHARNQVDRLFGKGKWTEQMNYGDVHGLRCWVTQLEDGSTEDVWFDYSPAAALVARREAGEKVGILASLPNPERRKLQTAVRKAMLEVECLTQLRESFIKGGQSYSGSDVRHWSSLIAIGCVGVLIFASGMGDRVCAGVGLVVAILMRSKYLSPREILNRKIDASYAEYQRINPGQLWPGTAGEAESRATHRKWWKTKYDFNFPEVD